MRRPSAGHRGRGPWPPGRRSGTDRGGRSGAGPRFESLASACRIDPFRNRLGFVAVPKRPRHRVLWASRQRHRTRRHRTMVLPGRNPGSAPRQRKEDTQQDNSSVVSFLPPTRIVECEQLLRSWSTEGCWRRGGDSSVSSCRDLRIKRIIPTLSYDLINVVWRAV